MTRRPTAAVAAGAVLLGCATGLRSQMGMAAVVNGLRPPELPGPLRHRQARLATASAAAGELVVDKLPNTPDRTARGGLIPRVLLGALSSGIVASAAADPVMVTSALGAGAAATSAFIGLAGRRRLALRMPALTAGLIEDAVAIGLALSAVAVVSLPPGRRAAGAA